MDKKQTVRIYSVERIDEGLTLPFVGNIPAGFVSPAADYIEDPININSLLIRNKDYTFIGKIDGTSMIDASLNDQDIVIIDRSLEPRDNDMVVVSVDGEFTIKYVSVDKDKKIWLVPANPDFQKVEVTPESDFRIWGVVTYSITKHRG